MVHLMTQDVNTHQLDSYHLIMKNKAETLTSGSSVNLKCLMFLVNYKQLKELKNQAK